MFVGGAAGVAEVASKRWMAQRDWVDKLNVQVPLSTPSEASTQTVLVGITSPSHSNVRSALLLSITVVILHPFVPHLSGLVYQSHAAEILS